MNIEDYVAEERWVPIAQSGERWAGRSREAAEEAMNNYPVGGRFASGDPWDGITHIVREVRFVTEWIETAPNDNPTPTEQGAGEQQEAS
jgi:hypothetical protein